MTQSHDDVLAPRFAALAHGLDDSDWKDVLARAGADRRRRPGRRLSLALALLLAAAFVVVVAPALGIGLPALDFFAGKHAPKRVVVQFEQMNAGAPARWNPHARAGQTRLVTTYHLRDGRSIPLWVAPKANGGFCFVDAGGGCVSPDAPGPNEPGDANGRALTVEVAGVHGSTLLTGSVFEKRIAEVEIRFRHAAPVRVPLLWVSRPIDAGFFFYQLTSAERSSGGTKAVVALDAQGSTVARIESAFRPQPVWANPRKVADLAKERVILRSGAASIAIAPSRTGGDCFWLRYGRTAMSVGCAPPRYLTTALAGGLSHGPAFTVFSGQVKPDVARVELRFQDGALEELVPVDGFVLYTIPAAHWPRGHRLDEAVGFSSAGKRLASERFDPTDIGLYPCKTPKPIGAGLTACP